MGGTGHLCDQRNGCNYKPDGKSVPCQLRMGTQAGFAFALNSVGWIIFCVPASPRVSDMWWPAVLGEHRVPGEPRQ